MLALAEVAEVSRTSKNVRTQNWQKHRHPMTPTLGIAAQSYSSAFSSTAAISGGKEYLVSPKVKDKIIQHKIQSQCSHEWCLPLP